MSLSSHIRMKIGRLGQVQWLWSHQRPQLLLSFCFPMSYDMAFIFKFNLWSKMVDGDPAIAFGLQAGGRQKDTVVADLQTELGPFKQHFTSSTQALCLHLSGQNLMTWPLIVVKMLS